MDPAQVLEWMKAAHRESQQQQTALIQQLSTQHQEHQRQLLKELAEQFKEQTRLSLAQIPAAAAREDDSEEMGEAGPRPSIRLTKMGATDDPEAYLTTFERVATTARWPESHWATILAPYLTGQAKLAYRSLSDRDALHYYKVKEAILDQMGITPETYRQKFRGEQYSPGTRPRVVAQRLREAAWRWLDPEQRTGPQVAELVVLEQFINILPSGGARWVRRHHPSTLSEAIELMNDYEAAEGWERGHRPERPPPPRRAEPTRSPRPKGSPERNNKWDAGRGSIRRPLAPSWSLPSREGQREGSGRATGPGASPPKPPAPRGPCFRCGQEGHHIKDCPFMDCSYAQALAGDGVPTTDGKILRDVKIGDNLVTALVDSGCSQTMVRAELVPQGGPRGPPVQVQCVHGDTHRYSTAWVRLRDEGEDSWCYVILAPRLAYPALLGRDWTGFRRAVGQWQRSEGSGEEGERIAALGETPTGNAPTAPEGGGPNPEELGHLELDDGDFLQEQREDPTLRHAWDTACEEAEGQAGTADRPAGPHFEVRADRLYRVDEGGVDQGTRRQLLVPRRYRYPLMEVAHANPWAGHLGQEKTVKRILQRFYWPGVYREVRDFCESCPQCQKAGPRNVPKAPLVPLPVVDVPFERIAMDVVGPLDKSKAGHQYILVILDYATRYPEAVPLRNTYATTIATELMKLFSRVGLPREILTDQGTNFTSRVMSELCRLFQIKSIRTSVYHPQTDGLVERFNRTLKGMLRRFTEQDPRDWDTLLPALLFAVREAPQASTGFSPFELLYGRQPRGILDVIRERWEDQETRVRGSVQYILDLRQRLRSLAEVARDNLESAQEVQARYYNRGARLRVFEPGQRVLLLLPTPGSKLVAKWQGPFEVVRRIGEVDYEVKLTGRAEGTKVYHVNLLKAWKGREAMFINPLPPDPELGPGGVEQTTPGLLQLGDDLDPEQRMEMEALLHQFPDVMTEQPGHTAVTYHHIETEPGKKVRDQVRPLPRKMWEPVKEELQRMIQWGVVEESYSEWRSPIVLVPKPDGSMRFCIDFRKVNALSRFDAYPMPRVDELLDRLGGAQYLSTLDLTRGYWQIPLSPPSREKTAFSTPFGLYHFVRMPFGLHGAAATFQRLMDRVLKTHDQFAAAYIDDIVVYSKSWAEHLQHVKAILQELRQAGLTANPRKCHFGEKEVSYLGYTVGRGRLRPLVEKVAALRTFQPPRTKRQATGSES
ncbi:uncharacterized protein LOC142819454 [Pelodiscus sinensis]|uniref:uncharacterized protein LOC142819454 n=1 Tax=Pelodiscus sinensis TaxID=13735 RepID=UPI003F6D3ABD